MNIGNIFFTLHDNEVKEFVIDKIVTETTIKGSIIRYYTVGFDTEFNPSKCFRTKKELIESLYKDS